MVEVTGRKHVWVVCVANICRSPMAAALLQQKIDAAGLRETVAVHTAGVLASPGQPLDPNVDQLLARHGAPLEDQVASQLSHEDIQKADMILVLEEAQRRSIFNRSPENLHKVFLLSELIGRHFDVADPHGLSPSAYEQTFQQIQNVIEEGWPTLCRFLGVQSPPSTPA